MSRVRVSPAAARVSVSTGYFVRQRRDHRRVSDIADARQFPLAVDGVRIQAVLEHVVNPEQVLSEISRVLKPGGLVYAETPFMQQVHEGAYDFTRFTEVGHRWLFRNFETISRGALGGPGLSLYWAAKYFLRGLTRSRWLGDLLSLPFALAALMDGMIREDHKIDGGNWACFLERLCNEFPQRHYQQSGALAKLVRKLLMTV